MGRLGWGALGVLSILAFGAAYAQAPAPPPPRPGLVAPKLSTLSAKEAQVLQIRRRHCLLKVGKDIRLVASETERRAVAVIDGSLRTLRYQGTTPIRNGGRFLPSSSSSALDIWIAVNPLQDRSLANGLPRDVTVMINGKFGNSDAYPATYTCDY